MNWPLVATLVTAFGIGAIVAAIVQAVAGAITDGKRRAHESAMREADRLHEANLAQLTRDHDSLMAQLADQRERRNRRATRIYAHLEALAEALTALGDRATRLRFFPGDYTKEDPALTSAFDQLLKLRPRMALDGETAPLLERVREAEQAYNVFLASLDNWFEARKSKDTGHAALRKQVDEKAVALIDLVTAIRDEARQTLTSAEAAL